MEERINFDFNEVLEQFKNGKNLTGKDVLLKQLTETLSDIDKDVLSRTRNRKMV